MQPLGRACSAAAIRSCVRHCCRIRTRALSSAVDQQLPSGLPKPRLDYRGISENIVFKSHNAFNRKAALPVGAIQSIGRLYEERNELNTVLNTKRHARHTIGDRVRASAQSPQEKQAVLDDAKSLKSEIAELETRLGEVEDRLYALAIAIPNDTHPDVPIGPESEAAVLSTHGPTPIPASPARDHVAICRALNLLDLEAGATVTGSSWYYLVNEAAILELVLVNYALSLAMKHGFTPVTTPDVVRADIATRCGFQPRDQNADPPVHQMYHIANAAPNAPDAPHHPELVLAGTAEIPLAGMFANQVLLPQELPRKVVGLGRAFRAEAGASGADTRGLYRVHQFTKLELFVVCEDAQSEDMMEQIKRLQIEIFEGLNLPFRVLDMPTEELGASAYRKYDVEAWMPGRGSWGEISSTSNCTDYQARRLHIRHRRTASQTDASETSGVPFAHTLNGTAAAIPRLIVALLENGARFDESGAVVGFDLPASLRPFWIGGNHRGVVYWV